MSVVKQKYAVITGDIKKLDVILNLCLKEETFYIDDPPLNVTHIRHVISDGELNPYILLKQKLLQLRNNLINTDKNPNEINSEKVVDTDLPALKIDDITSYVDNNFQTVYEITNKLETLKNQIDENEAILANLMHFKDIDVPLKDIFDLHYIKVRFGYFPVDVYSKVQDYIGMMKNVIFVTASTDDNYIWGLYFTVRDNEDDADALFEALNFKRQIIPYKAGDTPQHTIGNLTQQTDSMKTEYNNVKNQLTTYSQSVSSDIVYYLDIVNNLSDIFDIKKKVMSNENNFTFYGWISNKASAEFVKKLQSVSGVTVSTDNIYRNISVSPPVVIKNIPFVRSFQNFIEMYGAPSYDEIDPTPLVALTYCLFFGMMFGDIGQGAAIILVGLFMWLKMKMWLGKIVSIIGAFSIGFGFFYGIVFGIEDLLPGYKPNEHINEFLIASVVIGAIMIIFCMGLNIYNGFKKKNFAKAVFSSNGIVGLIFYVSVLGIVLEMFGFLQAGVPVVVFEILIILTVFILIIHEPIIEMIEHKKDWMPKNIGEFLVSSFFELFEVVLSFVTNTISFIRIGAFTLIHAGMMQVVFLLAESPSGEKSLPILIIGNIVVIVLEGLLVGIQVLRLEFYEVFSRFYEGGGHIAGKAVNQNEQNK
jgi:V/A-type H+-transporting ATPase subunit I